MLPPKFGDWQKTLDKWFPFGLLYETIELGSQGFAMDNKEIIKKIKALRAEKGYSLNQLSHLTGLSKGFLSKIENGISVPTVTSLRRIANALGADLTTFFMNNDLKEQKKKIVVVRKNEREKIDAEFQTSGITRWPLADKKFGRNLDPFIIELPHDHDQVYQFEGEEFYLLLEGTVELSYGGERYILEEGDCVYLDGDIPYTGRSLSEKPAKILMIHYEYNPTTILVTAIRVLRCFFAGAQDRQHGFYSGPK